MKKSAKGTSPSLHCKEVPEGPGTKKKKSDAGTSKTVTKRDLRNVGSQGTEKPRNDKQVNFYRT